MNFKLQVDLIHKKLLLLFVVWSIVCSQCASAAQYGGGYGGGWAPAPGQVQEQPVESWDEQETMSDEDFGKRPAIEHWDRDKLGAEEARFSRTTYSTKRFYCFFFRLPRLS